MKSKSVDEYIAKAPKDIQPRLQEVRKTIKETVPDAQERISYNIPFYEYHGRLVYFAYAKQHIGIYAIFHQVRKQFEKELKSFVMEKGTIRFPNNEDLPLVLLKKLVKAQAKYNKENEK